jgi:hypothetical protein
MKMGIILVQPCGFNQQQCFVVELAIFVFNSLLKTVCKLTLTFENVSMKQLFSFFVIFVFQWETERNIQLGEILARRF